MKLVRFISANRWPAFLGGILMMSITAQGVLVYVATRPSTPRPIANYYERSLDWDADAAVLAASRELGWSVAIDVPAGDQYTVAASRPVDLIVRDRDGEPVTGLAGRLISQPPAESRKLESPLTELPHDRGHYRTLAPLGQPGVWLLSIDAELDGAHFVHSQRITVGGGKP
jgi:nitrogen fixation protein FixH